MFFIWILDQSVLLFIFNVILSFSEEIGFDSQFLEDPEFNNVLDDLLAGEDC